MQHDCAEMLASLWEERKLGDLIINKKKTFFKISDKGMIVHLDVIKARCPKLLENMEKQDEKYVLSYPDENKILKYILQYCYFSNIEFEKLTMDKILQIECLSKNLELFHLQYISEKYLLENCMKFEDSSAYHLLYKANQIGNSRMENFVTQFFVDNYNIFLCNNSMRIIDVDIFQSVVEAFQNRPPPPKIEVIPDTLQDDYFKMDCFRCNMKKSARK